MHTQETILSIIIPVYNATDTIDRCLKSVVQSAGKRSEIICIDDGSGDDSADKIMAWQQRDSRIKIIRQENKGVSEARNAGLRVINGEYVVFVDADDEVQANYFTNLLEEADKNNAELVVCGYIYRTHQGDTRKRLKQTIIHNPTPAQMATLPEGVCSHLYKTEILQTNGKIIEFPQGVRFGEDTAFHYAVAPKIKTLVLSSETGYIVHLQPHSASQQATPLVGDMINALQWIDNQYTMGGGISIRAKLLDPVCLSHLTPHSFALPI